MGTLILSGGGNAEQTFEISQYFVQGIYNEKPLLYIPIAGDTEIRSYKSSLNYICSIFKPLGIKNITMWTDVKDKTIQELNQFSAVYISGGNTLSLLNDFKEALFDKMLLQYYKNGGTIYGQSAGAIIFGNSVSHTSSKNDNYDDCKGLNLVKNYSLWCHYSAEDDLSIKDYLMKGKKSFILLPEGSATLVNEKNIIGIGDRKPMIIKLDRFGEISKKIISY